VTFQHYDRDSGWIIGGVVAILATIVAAIFVFWLLVLGFVVIAIYVAVTELVAWGDRRAYRKAHPPKK
jgi:hypothetical protein